MGAENPNEQLPQGPEQKEWQGQRWEYLVVEMFGHESGVRVLERKKGEGLKGKPTPDLLADFYNRRLEEVKKHNNGVSVRDGLDLFGNDGWEFVGAVNEFSMNGTGLPVLILKRAVPSSK